MTEALAVFIGGGIGAVLRWQFQHYLNVSDKIPWGTFTANMLGGLIVGICLALAARLSADTRLFVVTGILGGFTTFSALSAEIFHLGLRGEYVAAIGYGFGSLLLGVCLCWVGFAIMSRLL